MIWLALLLLAVYFGLKYFADFDLLDQWRRRASGLPWGEDFKITAERIMKRGFDTATYTIEAQGADIYLVDYYGKRLATFRHRQIRQMLRHNPAQKPIQAYHIDLTDDTATFYVKLWTKSEYRKLQKQKKQKERQREATAPQRWKTQVQKPYRPKSTARLFAHIDTSTPIGDLVARHADPADFTYQKPLTQNIWIQNATTGQTYPIDAAQTEALRLMRAIYSGYQLKLEVYRTDTHGTTFDAHFIKDDADA